MSLIGMQMACSCSDHGPTPMDILVTGDGTKAIWDGMSSPMVDSGMVAGRRYVWKCMSCGHTVCLNLTLQNDIIDEND